MRIAGILFALVVLCAAPSHAQAPAYTASTVYAASGGVQIGNSAQTNCLALDKDGHFYFTDSSNQSIKKLTKDAALSTIAGGGASPNLILPATAPASFAATSANLGIAGNVALDADGHVYTQVSTVIWKIAKDGTMSKFADVPTIAGAQDFVALSDGSFYYRGGSATTVSVEKIDKSGAKTTLFPAVPEFRSFGGMAVAANGNVYLSVTGNGKPNGILKIAPDGTYGYIFGEGTDRATTYGGEEAKTFSTTDRLGNLALGPDGSLFFTRLANYAVYQITPDGRIYTIAGTATRGNTGDGGPATAATFNIIAGLVVDAQGHVYVADSRNNNIRKLTRDIPLTEGNTGGAPGGTTDPGGSGGTPTVSNEVITRADFSGDGAVGFDDFLTFASAFGAKPGDAKYDARIDMDGDGAVGFADFLIFITTFGKRVSN